MMQQIEVYDPKIGPMPDGPMAGMDHAAHDAHEHAAPK
jgi:hypothetical protein